MKKIFLVVSTLLMSVFVVACQNSSSKNDSADTEKKDLNFVIVPKTVHPWFDEVNEAAQEQADVLGEQLGIDIKVDYRAPESATVEEQNSLLESAAATK